MRQPALECLSEPTTGSRFGQRTRQNKIKIKGISLWPVSHVDEKTKYSQKHTTGFPAIVARQMYLLGTFLFSTPNTCTLRQQITCFSLVRSSSIHTSSDSTENLVRREISPALAHSANLRTWINPAYSIISNLSSLYDCIFFTLPVRSFSVISAAYQDSVRNTIRLDHWDLVLTNVKCGLPHISTFECS